MKKFVFHSHFTAMATGMFKIRQPGITELPGCGWPVGEELPELLPKDVPVGFTLTGRAFDYPFVFSRFKSPGSFLV